ncbi:MULTISPECIES: hypothetical protein [unclassified Amycolatopsis]|uniref:hypothetical protein n=1 Tax=unclassified Amycolatopsis TaxID=2618356 RepID=UPI001C6982A2|nr:hypothetical protein [Amycolatopsis sp. DSM 110486]QYN19270.1 hypothetical protein K1T34_42670 [Amycolatopsis sp. DSM 110486]
MAQPSAWSQSGRPCYRTGSAPSFLWTEKQLRDHGLRPATGAADAFVESQHGPAALYLITACELDDPHAWPPIRPAEGGPGSNTPTWRV